MMRLHLCLFLWRTKILCYGCNAGCGGDAEKLRCRAFEAASGVPVMKLSCLWWWTGLQHQSAAGGMEMKCSRAHSSDKMAGRKSEGCQQKTNIIKNRKYDTRNKYWSALCYANMQVHPQIIKNMWTVSVSSFVIGFYHCCKMDGQDVSVAGETKSGGLLRWKPRKRKSQ